MVEYVPQPNDDNFTTLRITKRARRKFGMLVDKNSRLDDSFEKMMDDKLKLI